MTYGFIDEREAQLHAVAYLSRRDIWYFHSKLKLSAWLERGDLSIYATEYGFAILIYAYGVLVFEFAT